MLTPEQVAECLAETGIAYMFAPNHHAAMKHAAPVRKEMGVRTFFNILGPLTNPAGAPNQLLGVFHPDLVGIQVRVLQRLGSEHVMVVYGMNGMDEISLSGETLVGELKDGSVREYTVHPSDFGLPVYDSRVLRWPTRKRAWPASTAHWPTKTARCATSCCSTPAPRCTAPARRPAWPKVCKLAREAVASGKAMAKLSQFVACTQRFKPAG
jgi:anthranilate phosphoribosyltransferase